MGLTGEQVQEFIKHGCTVLAGAVPTALAAECRRQLWGASGCDPADPTTWTRPVVRIPSMATAPFVQAANTPALHRAFDQLVGSGGWVPRTTLGTFPLRFPHPDPPGDDGWHVEASYPGPAGEPWLDVTSSNRALLLLFLFSDVGPDDAPTRIRLGSHRDVAALLAPAGAAGRPAVDVAHDATAASATRPEALATGRVGDVWLCHPFLVHSAQPHRARTPRFMAQPALHPAAPMDLHTLPRPPVVAAVHQAVHQARHHLDP